MMPRVAVLGVVRKSTNETMHDLYVGGALTLGFDVVRMGEQSALQIAARGGADLVEGSDAGLQVAPWFALSMALTF